MHVLEFLELQIKEYKKELIRLKEEGYSVADREKVERKIWFLEELQENYLDMEV